MYEKDDDQESGSADLFDRERRPDYLAFVVGAVKRRRLLVAGVVSAIVALAIVAIVALPRMYHVESRLFTQHNAALDARRDEKKDGLTRGTVETIRRRDNLVAIVQATDLVRHSNAHRAPAQRMLDRILRRVPRDPVDEQDGIDAMVARLGQQLTVAASDGTITIAIDWPDAQMALRLVEITQQNFLEARKAQEVTALSEAVSFRRSHAESLRKDIDDAVAALDELQKNRRRLKAEGGFAAPGARAAQSLAEPRLLVEQMQTAITSKQRAIDDIEALRRRQLSDAQGRLAEQSGTYTDNHPAIVDLQRTIAALSAPSPQVETLREQIASLRTRGRHLPFLEQEDRDPATVYARGRLHDAMARYAASWERVDSAQMDLDAAQVAFKYRYSVIAPATLPKAPTRLSMLVMALAALVAGAFAAVFVAVVADIRAGKIVERWQLARLTGQPILGEIDV